MFRSLGSFDDDGWIFFFSSPLTQRRSPAEGVIQADARGNRMIQREMTHSDRLTFCVLFCLPAGGQPTVTKACKYMDLFSDKATSIKMSLCGTLTAPGTQAD